MPRARSMPGDSMSSAISVPLEIEVVQPRNSAGVFRYWISINTGVSINKCPAGEPQEDVLERRPPHESALRDHSFFVHVAQRRVTVERVEQQTVGEDLDPFCEALQLLCCGFLLVCSEPQLEHLARRVTIDQLAWASFSGETAVVHDSQAVA